MPIHEYRCLGCGHAFEYLLRGSAQIVNCPHCQGSKLERRISSFSFSSSGARPPAAGSSSGCGSCSSHNCSSCAH